MSRPSSLLLWHGFLKRKIKCIVLLSPTLASKCFFVHQLISEIRYFWLFLLEYHKARCIWPVSLLLIILGCWFFHHLFNVCNDYILQLFNFSIVRVSLVLSVEGILGTSTGIKSFVITKSGWFCKCTTVRWPTCSYHDF